jgi:energy-coupling factor transporter transmembrane protein EcfT
MLTEADDRAMALEMRGLGARVARTPLAPPPRRAGDRIARWAIGALVVAGIAWRLLA